MKRLSLLFLVAMFAFAQAPPHSVTLTWSAPLGGSTPTGYNVKRATVSGGPYTTVQSVTVLTATDPFQITDEGKKFFYVVTSTGPGGESGNSNEVSATIPFSVPGAPTGLSVQVK